MVAMKSLLAILFLSSILFANEAGQPFALDVPLKTKWKEKLPYFYEASYLADKEILFSIERPALTLSLWGFNPLQKLKTQTIVDENIYNFWLGSDKNLVVLMQSITAFGFSVLDIKQRKIIGSIRHNEKIYNIIITPKGLVTRDNKKLILWDTKTFKKREIIQLNKSGYDNGIFYKPYFLMLSKDEKTLVTIDENKMVYIDMEKFEVIKTVTHFETTYYTGVDKGVFYYQNDEGSFKLDIQKDSSEKIDKYWIKEHKFELKKRKLSHPAKPMGLSGDAKYIVKAVKGKIEIYSRKDASLLVTIHSYKDGRWIAITPDGYFDLSNNTREYLRVESISGAPILINDITYNKYHRELNLDKMLMEQ